MAAPIAYLYHYLTGEFVAAIPRPLDAPATAATGVMSYKTPPHSTAIAPPEAPAGHVAIFANAAWTIVPDHRRETWYFGSYRVMIDWPGDPTALGMTREPPEVPSGSAAPALYAVDSNGLYTGILRPGLDVAATEAAGEVKWLALPGTVAEAPPEAGAKQAARWTGAAWELIPDHRGETWYDAAGKATVVAAAGDPAPLTAEPPVMPRVISARQFYLAVYQLGWTDAVNAAVATLPPPVQIEFQHTSEFHEDNAGLIAAAAAMGKTAADITQFFDFAITL